MADSATRNGRLDSDNLFLFFCLDKNERNGTASGSRQRPRRCLAGGDGDVGVVSEERAGLRLAQGEQRPGAGGEHEVQRQRHVDDDLPVQRLLRGLVLDDVRAAGVPDPAGNVQEANARVLRR